MKRKFKFLSYFLTLTLLLSGCSKFSVPTNANVAFENFTMQIFREDVASSTLGLHYSLKDPEAFGIEPSRITFGEYSADNTQALIALENLEAALHKFSYHSLSEENQITYDVLASYIKEARAGTQFTLFEEPLSSVTGIHAQLPVLLAEYSFQAPADVETYLKLIETMPDYFDSLIAFEESKANAGLFMPLSALEEILEQCKAFLDMGEKNYLLSTFEERLDRIDELTASQRSTFIHRNQELLDTAILPAYRNLVSALSSLKNFAKNSQGLCYLDGGKMYYAYLVGRETGSSRTVDEIKALIESQIADDLLSMQKVLQENPSLAQETATPLTETPDAILADLRNKITDSFPASPEVSVEIKYVPKDLEEHLSPAFYLIPAIDAPDENVIYINGGQSLEDIRLFTTLAHEGYPGHLYQTTYYAATDPDPLRTIFNFKGYVEGWATYAEMCSYYLSPLEKSYATLLQKNNSLILGLYALADIGIHHEGWDLKRTVQFFRTYGIEDETTIAEIYQLILADPANYLAYHVGYLEILDLKRTCMEEKGNSFSQKEFHKRLLEIGPAPFEIVKKLLTGT